MSEQSDRLRGRREALLRRSDALRLDCAEHVQEIETALLLGRTRSRWALAAGLALVGQLAIQLVRRSR